jgi:glutamate carboxypeptidase
VPNPDSIPTELTEDQAGRLLSHFEGRRDDLLRLTRRLCVTESPSGDAAGSRAVVEVLARAAREIRAVSSVERIEAANGFGEHLRVEAFGSDGARPLLILGHTDTVHPHGSLSERPWREEDGRIYAPGIFDMKIGCAVAVEVIRACAELDMRPRRPIVLLLTCDEEKGSESGRALVEREARLAESVLVLEPPAPGGRVKTERKGTGMFVLSAEGRAAHAGLDPEKGASAVLEIARQVERLHALADPDRGTTVNVGVVRGGTHSNVVAAEARAEIDVRFTTPDEAERVERAIRVAEPFDSRVKLSVTGGLNRPPLERTPPVAALYEHARRQSALLGFDLGEASVGGASDGNFAAACGAPVLDGLGVEGDGAHAVHEHILIEGVAPRAALIAALAATL